MAYCTRSLSSNQVQITSFNGAIKQKWRVSGTGTLVGEDDSQCLSCTSYGDGAMCTVNGKNGLISIDGNGAILWQTDVITGDSGSWRTVPIALDDGGAIVKDDVTVAFLDNTGSIIWSMQSPTIYELNLARNGLLVAVMKAGGLLSIDMNGSTFASLLLDYTIDGIDGTFIIIDTPAMFDDIAYVATQFVPDNANNAKALNTSYSAVYAIKV
jgi:hypothetical protein